jgi:L-histidine N-alpha-methyltransferase
MQLSASRTTAEDYGSTALSRFAASVRAGLTTRPDKQLSPEYFYDEVGSALFEAITVLPEYGLTRADRRILSRHAAEIARLTPIPVSVVELGSGSGAKTAHVLRSVAQSQQGQLDYYPIDVSASALECCRRELFTVAQVYPVQATFVAGVRVALRSIPAHHRLLLLFLGSTIGNFSREAAGELLSELRGVLSEGDVMLIGADLVKPADRLLPGYDDPAGVTAAFNLNLLARINRELGANFDLRRFRHQARYDADRKRVEMHLVSQTGHRVEIPGAECEVSFAAGESIWTESSHKYDLSDLEDMARAGGFSTLQTWTDQEWPFAESLWQAV